MREFKHSIVTLVAAALVFAIWSFFTGFEKWPWRETSHHWSGTHYGFTVGASEESAFQALAIKTGNGEVRGVEVIHSEPNNESEVVRVNIEKLEELQSIEGDLIWIIYLSDCRCNVGVVFSKNEIQNIAYSKHFLLPEFRMRPNNALQQPSGSLSRRLQRQPARQALAAAELKR